MLYNCFRVISQDQQKSLYTRKPRAGIIVLSNMASRACALLLAITVVSARECLEPVCLTLPDQSILTDSILNGTILKFTSKNESNYKSARFNVLELWERFPRVFVPRNGTSEQCRRDSQLFLDSLDRLELWALKSNCFQII